MYRVSVEEFEIIARSQENRGGAGSAAETPAIV
jgi:hypothetical protein